VKPRPYTHTKCGLRFPPQYHISNRWGYYSAPLHIIVFSRCYVQRGRPVTTLDCVLLKDNNWALVARSGPEINPRACLCVLQGPRHNTRCWFSIHHFIFLLIFCLETPKKGSGPTHSTHTWYRTCKSHGLTVSAKCKFCKHITKSCIPQVSTSL